jgi:Fur family peroxide stress response transcriptional regulator
MILEHTHIDLAKNKLQEVGLKITIPRLAIYAVLMNSKDHPTAEKLQEHLQSQYSTISLATIYKNLDILVANGLVSKVKSIDGYYRYDPKTAQHSHIYCENTNEIIDFEDPELDQILTHYFQKKQINNIKINNISLQINAEKLNLKRKISIQ